MKKKSMLKNTIYYLIYNVLNLLFPLISGIYAARVISPQRIGEVTYSQNIVQYFVILSFLGIPTYGVREISNVRNNKKELSKVYSELFLINFMSTLLFLILYFILIQNIENFRENIKLYWIMGLLLFFNIFNINWLYEGLEEFKFISLRNIIFKSISLLLLIYFVKDDMDYLKFAGITTVGTIGNYLINIIYSKKYVTLTFKQLNFKRHMRSILYLLSVNIAIEIYTLVDVSMLGFFCIKDLVAYYVYGSRIYRILLQVMNTFTVVVVPRLSYLYNENKKEEFNELLNKTVKIILLFGIPMLIGIQFTSVDMITLIYGKDYRNSAEVIKIMSILLILSPIGYLLGSRVLLITKNEKKMILAVSIGAISNLIGNFLLIRYYNEIGAALSTTLSEILVMIVYIYLSKKYYKLNLKINEIVKIIFANVILLFFLMILNKIIVEKMTKLIIQIIMGIVVYFIMLFLQKEELIYNRILNLKIRLLKNEKEKE